MRNPLVLFILVLMLVGGGILVTAVIAPTNLTYIQEEALGILHGGIRERQEQQFVDNCIPIEGQEGLRNVTRIRRTVFYNDGTLLETIYSGAPEENANC